MERKQIHMNRFRHANLSLPVFTLLLLISITFNSCQDFIEEDISGETTSFVIPQNNDTIAEFSSFVWDEIEGATKYHLEVVSPNFTTPNFIAYDTLVNGTDIFLTLSPNQYQLRVTGKNNGYDSETSDIITVYVDSISGSQSQIDLISPANNSFENGDFNGLFNWSSLPNVSSYEISIRQGTDFETGTIVYTQNNISTTTHTASSATFTEGNYTWAVKANFTQGGTTQNFISSFKVDTEAPVIPSLQTPNDFATVTSPVEFTWTNGADNGTIQSPVTTYIDIATDVNFNNIVQSNSTQSNSIELTINQPGTYYWSLYNVDEAGNVGDFSATREFTIN